MKPSSRSNAAITAALALVVAANTASLLTAEAQQFSISVNAGPATAQNSFLAGSLTAEFSSTQQQGGQVYGTGHGYAFASSQPGFVSANTLATAWARQPHVTGGYVDPVDPSATANADADAHYQDMLTILGPGIPTGTPGTARVHIGTGGLIDVTTDFGGPPGWTWARANASVQVWGTVNDAHWNFFEGFGTSDSPLDTGIPGSADLLFHYQYGVPFAVVLGMNIGGSVSAWADRWGYASIHGDTLAAINFSFGEGMYWGGLTDVTANGVPLEPGSYSARSLGNIDFTGSFAPAEIPEPASWMAGLTLLVAASASRLGRVRPGQAGHPGGVTPRVGQEPEPKSPCLPPLPRIVPGASVPG